MIMITLHKACKLKKLKPLDLHSFFFHHTNLWVFYNLFGFLESWKSVGKTLISSDHGTLDRSH